MKIMVWREKSLNTLPMQYIFDWEEPGTPKRQEISELFCNVHERLKPLFGLDSGGWSFQHKRHYKPLQAADILAWEMNRYMPKTFPQGEREADLESSLHAGFKLLREDQEMDLGFFNKENLDVWYRKIQDHEAKHGIIP